MHNPWPTDQIRDAYVLYPASEQVRKYKKLLLNDGDFMNEFKIL